MTDTRYSLNIIEVKTKFKKKRKYYNSKVPLLTRY